ncbi:hypothetical protein Lalb_Chr04g0251131 [Lupinus albus]|uniref:Uncharacterized protein n=1 Tax=Lupinus albus TaxID=3870 RepID=A0A6A4QKK5_LUPAL|nr:hypothetical protein Lalb_Chr04g0251131 [Lupinus albus]
MSTSQLCTAGKGEEPNSSLTSKHQTLLTTIQHQTLLLSVTFFFHYLLSLLKLLLSLHSLPHFFFYSRSLFTHVLISLSRSLTFAKGFVFISLFHDEFDITLHYNT